MGIKLLLIPLVMQFFFIQAHGQKSDSTKVARLREARILYQQAQHFRTGTDGPMDYEKAFYLYGQAADMGDRRAEYALGYMHYKGLGCNQDYAKAVAFFRKGAFSGMDNAMYFLGLCLRNGYGVSANKDSAFYWLRFSDSLGNRQARQEILSLQAENSPDSAKQLVERIRNLALPDKRQVNRFVRIPNRLLSMDAIVGRYKGFLLQYDWSGENIVSSHPLELAVTTGSGGLVEGTWIESGTDSFRFSARMRLDSLVFNPVSYGRRDHYSPDSSIKYRLNNAAFNFAQMDNTVYLAGNVSMFSQDRGEPAKPMVMALSKNTEQRDPSLEFSFDKVYPNPFRDVLDIQFTIGSDANTAISVIGISGNQVYIRASQNLRRGSYSYRLQLLAGMPPGGYVLQVFVNGKAHAYKLLHI